MSNARQPEIDLQLEIQLEDVRVAVLNRLDQMEAMLIKSFNDASYTPIYLQFNPARGWLEVGAGRARNGA